MSATRLPSELLARTKPWDARLAPEVVHSLSTLAETSPEVLQRIDEILTPFLRDGTWPGWAHLAELRPPWTGFYRFKFGVRVRRGLFTWRETSWRLIVRPVSWASVLRVYRIGPRRMEGRSIYADPPKPRR